VADVVELLRPGLLSTVQDLGRPGLGRFGVSPSGAMDTFALRLANRLVGNADDAAALELTGPGAELLLPAGARVAIAGADLGARLDGLPLAPFVAVERPGEARLAFTARVRGGRAR
jgi:allophanate hydrolase subunit 2